MNYEHITLFPDNPWLTFGLGIAGLLIFHFVGKYIYKEKQIQIETESDH